MAGHGFGVAADAAVGMCLRAVDTGILGAVQTRRRVEYAVTHLSLFVHRRAGS